MKRETQQILIIGLGRFGMSLAHALSNYDCEVMAIDNNSELVDDVSEYVTHAAKVDATDLNALKELGVTNFDIAIIGIGDNLEASIMIALTLKELNVPYIVAKSRDDIHAKLLTMIGVDKVVQPEKDIGTRLAKTLMHKNVIERMEVGKEYSIAEVETPREWIGSRLNQLNIRPKYNINVLCVEKKDKKILIPSADYAIEEGDNIMLIAPNKELEPNGFLGRLN
ncbi:MAG: TrkA family potassium uptake protein [Clostridia bacterium]|nr:TrkA family potassium uptake protein [Clostridia bacterium]